MPGAKGRSGGDRRSSGSDEFPRGLPKKPSKLSRAESATWNLLLTQISHDLLRTIDVHQLMMLVRLLVREQVLAKIIAADPCDHPAGRAYLQTVQSIGRLSAQYGLGPADRGRLRATPEAIEEESKFSALLARMSGTN